MKSFTYLSFWEVKVLLLKVLFFIILTSSYSTSLAGPIIEKRITVNIPESLSSKASSSDRLMTIKWDVNAGDRVEVDGRSVLHRQLAEAEDWSLPCDPMLSGDKSKRQCKQVSFELKPNFVAPGVVVVEKEEDNSLKKDPKMEAFEKEVLDWKV